MIVAAKILRALAFLVCGPVVVLISTDVTLEIWKAYAEDGPAAAMLCGLLWTLAGIFLTFIYYKE